MNAFILVFILLYLCASLTALVIADGDIHIGYWYKDRECDPHKANGMYVKDLGDTYPVDAGAVYLVRPGNLTTSGHDCIDKGMPASVYACQAFGAPKRITCVRSAW